ncbi:MAG: hypothetical protein U9P50_01960 [Patescibacteria group bacterium]|nr:hypothetical protein [Patescibacteria group bacterium]
MNKIDIRKIIIVVVVLAIIYSVFFIFTNKKEQNQSINNLGTFFPFSNEESPSNNTEDKPTDIDSYSYKEPSIESIPILRQITASPTSGMIIFEDDTENNKESAEIDYSIRYIEKATGHIYETNTNSPTQTRISNTTIPKIQEAIWLDKESLVIRYLDEDDIIKTFSASIVESELGDKQLEGVFLQDDIQTLIKFKKGLFYLLESGQGSIGVTSDKDDENKKIIFNSPLKEWLIKNVDNRYINFTTKPAINVYGYSFLFDVETGSFDKIIDGKYNLSTLISNLFNILYSEYDKLGPKLYTYNNKKEVNTEVLISTLPEKCVWDEENIYIYCGIPFKELTNYDLTAWYKGNILFSDDIWRINAETNNLEFLISPTTIGVEEIDIINPILSENNDYLIFMNKRDFSLWSLKLKKDL